ncbi:MULTISPECIES: hypothetical protein [unclassified Bosea (in: a-proteobacteria)]|uniref:hypothetical protein n=1 Tax=unclassified Bosea (in: a-proteobacteria) TaxID=2653178 RepID=UPI000F750949|nr:MULTISPECIES: hypothetical protein [unclassified Bosea (in: a-proteobacteria)]AZO77525.1 hypothetical protein BLM15_07770 [Bosea sp. Tri-49]RXT18133.1 hypothetical protein B5U98_22935 [Bosea sp. Tri-39]RXT32730.1 hypothetical protein B5U99_29280 [Bosea sp. Tri-54]
MIAGIEMGKDTIRHLIFMRNRWRYKPSDLMKPHGFKFLTFGAGLVIGGRNVPSPEDQQRAIELNAEWDQIRTGVSLVARPKYLPGTVGHGYERAMKMRAAERAKDGTHQNKDQESRDDWPRAWKWLGPLWSDVDPKTVQPEAFLSIDAKTGEANGLVPLIEQQISISERHRVIKVWRALWKRMAAMGMCVADADPSLAFANRAPDARQDIWSEGEVVRLCKRAWRMGYKGMAACMATAWDSQLSPIDLRKLSTGQRADDVQGAIFSLARTKTGRAAAASLGKRATWALDSYISSLGFDLMPNAPIFRTRGGGTTAKGGRPHAPAPYSKNKLAEDFRTVREAEFGPDEDRKLSDMRRSGTVEATAGGADAHAVSAKMANTLSASARLQKTYNPVNLVTVRAVDANRREGRSKLRENKAGRKV